jgi:hypothetical protein
MERQVLISSVPSKDHSGVPIGLLRRLALDGVYRSKQRLREYELNVYRGPYTTPMWFHTVPFLVEEFTDPHNCVEPHGSPCSLLYFNHSMTALA